LGLFDKSFRKDYNIRDMDKKHDWSTRALADKARVHISYIRKLINMGKLKGAYKLGRVWAIPYQVGRTWLEERGISLIDS